MPLADATPTRTPVNEPGPTSQASPSSEPRCSPAWARTASTASKIRSAWPWRSTYATAASGSPSRTRAALPRGVEVERARIFTSVSLEHRGREAVGHILENGP